MHSARDVTLRKVLLNDAELLRTWRNHPDVRRYFFDKREIEHEDHLTWLDTSLKDPKKVLLMGLKDSTPFGIFRADLDADFLEATVSIYLNPSECDRGLGTVLLSKSIDWCKIEIPSIKKWLASVLIGNERSAKLFMKVGFEPVYTVFERR